MVLRGAVLLRTAVSLRTAVLPLLLGLLLLGQTGCVTSPSQEAWATVRVTQGDTLQAIAQHYRITVDELAEANDINLNDPIQVGQILVVPLTSQYTRARLAVKGGSEKAGRLIWPVQGEVSSDFGRRGWRDHEGIDIRAPKDTKIQAAHDGVVVFSGWKRGYGQTIILEHKSFRTLYAHCNRLMRRQGERVDRGDVIGLVGRTGNARGYHLHFEYRARNGEPLNPLDYLPASPALISRR